MRFIRSRKGDASTTFNVLELIPRLFLLVFVTLSIVIFVRHFLKMNIDVGDTQASVLINRFYYSPDCFSYVADTTGRPYPGIIDIDKFNGDRLDYCVYYGERNDYAAARLVLRFFKSENIDPLSKNITYNPTGYRIWKPLEGIEGQGGATSYTDSRYVLVNDGGRLIKAILDIEVLLPNY